MLVRSQERAQPSGAGRQVPMMHSILVGSIFVAMVLVPYVFTRIALTLGRTRDTQH